MRCAYAQLHEYTRTRLRPQPLATSGHRNNMQATVWRATCARAIQIALHALALAQFAADAQYHNMRVTVLRNSPQARSLKDVCRRLPPRHTASAAHNRRRAAPPVCYIYLPATSPASTCRSASNTARSAGLYIIEAGWYIGNMRMPSRSISRPCASPTVSSHPASALSARCPALLSAAAAPAQSPAAARA